MILAGRVPSRLRGHEILTIITGRTVPDARAGTIPGASPFIVLPGGENERSRASRADTERPVDRHRNADRHRGLLADLRLPSSPRPTAARTAGQLPASQPRARDRSCQRRRQVMCPGQARLLTWIRIPVPSQPPPRGPSRPARALLARQATRRKGSPLSPATRPVRAQFPGVRLRGPASFPATDRCFSKGGPGPAAKSAAKPATRSASVPATKRTEQAGGRLRVAAGCHRRRLLRQERRWSATASESASAPWM